MTHVAVTDAAMTIGLTALRRAELIDDNADPNAPFTEMDEFVRDYCEPSASPAPKFDPGEQLARIADLIELIAVEGGPEL